MTAVTSSTRTEVVAGLVLLAANPVPWERHEHTNGGWSLVIERWQIIGRVGWQRVTETWPAP